jgi:GTP-binding protein
VLIENMRREGYELGVSRPEVIIRDRGRRRQEPFEQLTVDVEEQHQGAVMEKLGVRGGELTNMNARTARAACAWITSSRPAA